MPTTGATCHDSYAAYLEAKADREALAARTESNRQNFLRTELEWLRRQPKARGTKQKARIERAEAARAATPARDTGQVELSAEVAGAGRSILLDRVTTGILSFEGGARDAVRGRVPGLRGGGRARRGDARTPA